jgi:hypothetical protein
MFNLLVVFSKSFGKEYAQTGIIITFDDMVISTDIVFKIICSGSRNVMYVSDIQLDYV